MPQQQQEQKYTYADYAKWPDDERWELIDGVPYAMSPSPSQFHQEISAELHRQLGNYLDGKSCRAYAAPFDVRLNVNENDDTVVQPDLLVVCDKSKLDGKCCNGAPDFVVEILSPSSSTMDRVGKFQAYLAAGVREYWIVDPESRTIQVCVLHDGFYGVTIHKENEVVPISILDGCNIILSKVFS